MEIDMSQLIADAFMRQDVRDEHAKVPGMQNKEYPGEVDGDFFAEDDVEGGSSDEFVFKCEDGSHENDKGGTHGDGVRRGGVCTMGDPIVWARHYFSIGMSLNFFDDL